MYNLLNKKHEKNHLDSAFDILRLSSALARILAAGQAWLLTSFSFCVSTAGGPQNPLHFAPASDSQTSIAIAHI